MKWQPEGQVEAPTKDTLDPVQKGMLELVSNHLVLFAPKTEHGLKLDYPELAAAPEFRDLGKHDMLFVWAWACRSSPFTTITNEKHRLEACVHYAYPPNSRKPRLSTFQGKIPDKVVRAIRKMEKYNLEARVIEYVLMQQVRKNIAAFAMEDVAGSDDAEKKAYLDQMKTAQQILADQRTRIEGMDLGVAEEGETTYKDAVDVWKQYMQDYDPEQDPD